jgi:diguanylate cyclase (GGDEF)-like protein
MWNSLDKMGRWEGEVWNRRKSGEVYPEQLSINVVKDESGGIVNFIGLFSDISQIKDHEDELKRLAQFDPLTSLPNRALLADRLQSAIASSDRNKNGLAVAYIDLDEFKQINDTYGHDVGDDLLIGVSNRLADSMRASDTIARIGGDEFVAIFNAISEVENLVPVLDRILQDLLEPFDIGGIRIQVSASIGVALYTTNKNTGGDQLQRQADQAMYEAKQAGRNTYRFFDPEQDSKISKRFALIAEVEKAISENEFELYYQPKVNMRSGEVIGAEALIRWNHPERGFLSPGQFLPEINEHKVGIDIGTWVIKSAVDQISDWEKIGLNLPISINISPDHLQQENFVDQLSVQIKQAKVIKPELLQLEILETSALEDFPLVTEVIQKCKGIGIDFALDDFGAGYSSLVYLKKLSVSTLKIDQEFVRNILNNPDDELILSGVIGLAEKFKLRVLAEGVETIEHAAVLLSLGCELGQGYAFAKPMQSVTFVEWLEQWKYKLSWQSSIEKFFADGNQKPAMKSE